MASEKIKIIYMGTPEFAVPPLKALLEDENFEVLAVLTQEDKKVGRKQILTPPPLKIAALEAGLPVFQPPKLKENSEITALLQGLEPDFFVVVAYGQILPLEILKIPKFTCINIHPSLLPKYRGATPIEEAILKGDSEIGITFMIMAEKMDAGPILEILRANIGVKDKARPLYKKMFEWAGTLLGGILNDYRDGILTPIPQKEELASYCHKISREDGRIDLEKMSALEIQNHFRAYDPWPGCFLEIDGKKLKLLEIELERESDSKNISAGEVVEREGGSIGIGTKKGVIIPLQVQLEGKNPLPIQDFLRGNRELLNKLIASPNSKKSST